MGGELIEEGVFFLDLHHFAFLLHPFLLTQLSLMQDVFFHLGVDHKLLNDPQVFGVLVMTYSY